MRLNAKNVQYDVSVLHESERPIRLNTGTIYFSLTAAEAIDIATQLADAVEQSRTTERKAP